MSRVLLPLCALLPALALAQSDPEFIPYDEPPEAPPPSRPYDPGLDEELRDEPQISRSFSRRDDPNIGIAFEGVVGAFFGDNAHRRGTDFRITGGLRATWEFGRLFAVPPWREGLVLDATWWASGKRTGTEAVFSQEALHLFTLAPAWHFPLGEETAWTFFVQGGVGLAYTSASITASEFTTPVAGAQLLLQYGVGLRARPQIGEHLHLTIRVELMRFRRGYLDDTWVGFSMGMAF